MEACFHLQQFVVVFRAVKPCSCIYSSQALTMVLKLLPDSRASRKRLRSGNRQEGVRVQRAACFPIIVPVSQREQHQGPGASTLYECY